MQIPSAMQIEMALEQLAQVPEEKRWKQTIELDSVGAEKLRAKAGALLSDDFRTGYELGLQTMRLLIAMTQDASKL